MADYDPLEIRIENPNFDPKGFDQAKREAGETTAAVEGNAASTRSLGEAQKEGTGIAEKLHGQHRALHLALRQVGAASKEAQLALTLLTGFAMGSALFVIRGLAEGVRMLTEHFKKQKEASLEAAKVTVEFWNAALKGKEEAVQAARNYAEAIQKMLTNTEALKQAEDKENTVLKAQLEVRLKIIDALRQAEIAAAKGDKAEEARINARYGRETADTKIKESQEEIDLKKKHLDEQQKEANRLAAETKAAQQKLESAKAAGKPLLVTESEESLKTLDKRLSESKAKQLSQSDSDSMKQFLEWYNANASYRVMYSPTWIKAQAAMTSLANDQKAKEEQSALEAEIKNRRKVVADHEQSMESVTKTAKETLAASEKAEGVVRGTKAEIDSLEAVQKVNVGASGDIKNLKRGETITAAHAPVNALSLNVMGDIEAMENVGSGGRMDAKQQAAMNHLIAGLHAQGATQDQINRILKEMLDLHTDAQQKFTDIWTALKQVQSQAAKGAGRGN